MIIQWMSQLRVKLPLILVATLILSFGIMGKLGNVESEKAFKKEGIERLSLVLEARERDLRLWNETIFSDVSATAQSESAARMLRDFQVGWTSLGATAREEIVTQYVGNNPNSADAREKMTTATDGSNYSTVHGRYHTGLVGQMQAKAYTDILLINPNGDIIYSVKKLAEFGENVNTSANVRPGLTEIFAMASKSKSGSVFVSDFAPSEPRDDLRADPDAQAYLGVGIQSKSGVLLGVLAYQVSLSSINSILLQPHGLGASGQSYILNDEGHLASALRLAQGSNKPEIFLDSPAITAALRGETGVYDGQGILGIDSIMAYRPAQILGLPHALVVEQAVEELLAKNDSYNSLMMMLGSIVILLFSGVMILIARSVTMPLKRIDYAMRRIGSGIYGFVIKDKSRKDEIGQIARSLGEFSDQLSQGEAVARDARLKGAAFEAGSSAVLMTDPDFNILYANSALVSLIQNRIDAFHTQFPNLDPEQIIGQPIEIFHPNPEKIRAILEGEAAMPFSTNIALGRARFTLDVAEVVMPEQGRIGFVLEWRDVTDTQMNMAILKSIDLNQMMIEFAPEGHLITANENVCHALGVSADTLLGKDLRSLLGGNEQSSDNIWATLQGRTPVSGRFTLKPAQGAARILQGAITPVLDRNQSTLKIVLIASDITEAQQEIEKAEQLRVTAQAAQQAVVETLRTNLTKLSRGDLSVRINETFGPEYEQLRNDFNLATQNLAEAMELVLGNSLEIENEAKEISGAAEDLSRRTEKQAATLEETAAALDVLTQSVKTASAGANEANRVVVEAREQAQSSGSVVRQAVDAMGQIENSSQQISKIIAVIDDIAFQTNLLALNAGVEAARAGEAGRGFAVVASEVRALAQRSSEAAREIDALISASSGHVKRGVGLVGEAGVALNDILTSVIDISARVTEIASSSQEQSAGLAEINSAVINLDQVTQQNAAMFEQTTAASHSLTRGAQSLSKTMSRFSLHTPQQVNSSVEKDQAGALSLKPGLRPSSRVVAGTKPAAPATAAPRALAKVRTRPKTVNTPIAQAVAASQAQVEVSVVNDDGWEDF